MSINYTYRRVVWEMLTGQAVGHAHLAHQIYRLAHVYREGLTPKEYEFLMQRYKVLDDEIRLISKLSDRLKRSLSG